MTTDHETVDPVESDVVESFARAALLAALMSAFAYVSIPLPLSPVPLTLQVLGVFLAGIFLGPRWGAVSMVLYLAAGAVGAPVFAGGSAGLGVLQGTTAGYLWSYPIAAAIVGLVVHRGTDLRDPATVSVPVVVVACVAATLLIYALGVAWLMTVLEVGVREGLSLGAAPYVPGEIVKIAAAVAIARSGAIDPR